MICQLLLRATCMRICQVAFRKKCGLAQMVAIGEAWQWAAAPGTFRNFEGVSGRGVEADTQRLEL